MGSSIFGTWSSVEEKLHNFLQLHNDKVRWKSKKRKQAKVNCCNFLQKKKKLFSPTERVLKYYKYSTETKSNRINNTLATYHSNNS